MRQTGLLMAFVCVASLLAMGQDDSSVQSKVIALEKAWNQAYKAGDIRALNSILDNEVVLINGTTVTRPLRLPSYFQRGVIPPVVETRGGCSPAIGSGSWSSAASHLKNCCRPLCLFTAVDADRSGYVPNVVYTCGAMTHNDQLILPYAVSDTYSNFATIQISALMRSMS